MRIGLYLLSASLLAFASMPVIAAEEMSWYDLLPPELRELQETPQPVHDLLQLGDLLEEEMGDPAVQSEPLAPVVAELDGREIKLPGYIVPLGITESGEVDEFLLVPYFGACIHVPPPPSNQIVHVISRQGIKLQDLYQPFWISGVIRVEQVESDLANAGYRINAARTEPYVY